MTFLLDVNVVIALLDCSHVSHEAAHRWFDQEGSRSWATCPIVENGALRILSRPSYPNTPGSPADVAVSLKSLLRRDGHQFWPDDISLLTNQNVDLAALSSSGRVTDTYLLALAGSKGGRLATFDRRLSASSVTGGREALHLILD